MEVKAVGYCRVSTGDQSNSLESQRQKIIEYCQYKGIELIELIVDEDVSGGKEIYKRQGGAKVKEYLTDGIKDILAIKPDRLFRNVKDALTTIDEWEQENINLHIVDMGGSSFNTQTAIGRLMFTTVISFAEFERKLGGERTKAVLNHRKTAKKAYCAQVFGYDKKEGELIPNENEQKVIMLIKSELLTNDVKTVCKKLNRMGYTTKGGNKWRREAIERVINNPLNKNNLELTN